MILNLTQHQATPEQIEAGVVEPHHKSEVVSALTFESLPTLSEVKHRALKLGMIATASGCSEAMIGGAPYLMRPLEEELLGRNITPLYAFSIRESVEEIQADGSVRKVQVFRHAGWVVAD